MDEKTTNESNNGDARIFRNDSEGQRSRNVEDEIEIQWQFRIR